MPPLPRLNLKLSLAAICFLAGTIILWRTFLRPPGEVSVAIPSPTAEVTVAVVADESTATSEPATPTAPATQASYPAPTDPATPTSAPSPSALLPTAAVDVPTVDPATLAPTATLAATPVTTPPTATPATRPTAPQAIATPTQVAPTLASTSAPTTASTQLPTTVAPTVVATIPTTIPTTTGITALPTSTPTLTATPTATDTTSTGATVIYRLEGLASLVVVSYIDADGNNKDVEVSLPWSIQFNAAVDADLAVDAYSNIEEAVALTCTIQVNGVTVASQQTQNAIDGVSCERFAQ